MSPPGAAPRPRLPFVLALAWRESRSSLHRAGLLVVAIALGTGALVAINSFTANLRGSVQREARELLGADLLIGSASPFTPRAEALIAELRQSMRPPAQAARVVSFGAMALAPAGVGTRLVQVQGVDPDYPFYGRIETRPAGEWSRLVETGGAIVDAGLLPSLGAAIGDDLVIGEARFVIRATVENLPGDVGVRSAIGPRVFIPRSRVDETRLLTAGARGRYEVYLRLPAAVSAAEAQILADRFRPALSSERTSVRTVAEDQRRLSEALGRFGSFLGLVALVAVLLGGLGVASAVHVFLKHRWPSIAVLRCLGAPAGILLGAYLLQAIAVGMAGSLLGAGLGASLQLLLPYLLRDLLPVDVPWVLSWSAVAGGIGVGVWVAAVFALLPLLAVRRVSPLSVLRSDLDGSSGGRDPWRLAAALALGLSVVALAAVQAGGLLAGLAFAGGIGVALLLLWLSAWLLVRALRRRTLPRLPYLYRQGVANLHRPANQTVLVVLALGFGAFLLATLLLVQHNLLGELRVDRGAARPNLVFFDVQPDQCEAIVELARAAGPLSGTPVPIVPMRLLEIRGRAAAELLAIEDEAERPERWALRREYRSSYRDRPAPSETLVAGEWWKPGEWRRAAEGAVLPVALEAGLARELKVGLGDAITWDVQGVPVATRVAALRAVEWARFEPNFFVIFPEGPLDAAPRSYVLLSRVEEAGERARLQRRVVEAHPNVSTLDLAQVQRAIESILDRVVLAVRFMALFSLGAGALVLAGAVASSQQQRIREGALLRTLGATRSQLLRILLAEYAVLGVLASAVAVGLASAAGWALVRFAFATPFSFPGLPLLALLLAVMTLTVAVGLAGSTQVWRRPPLEVLRGE